MKRELHARERLETPLAQMAFFLDGEELDDTRSLASYPVRETCPANASPTAGIVFNVSAH